MNDTELEYLFITLFICFILSAFFSSSETALTSLNKYRLKSAVKKRVRGSLSAEIITKRIDLLLILLLVFNNIVNVLAASIATIIGLRLHGDLGVAMATGILTIILLFFAEIIPKTIASSHSEKVSYLVSPIIRLLMFIFKPLVIAVNFVTRLLIKLLGLKENYQNHISHDELKIIISEGSNTNDNRKMMNSILDLEKISVDAVMTPESEIYSFDTNDDLKDIMRTINNSPHSIIVAYRESFEEIVGVLRVAEAYRFLYEADSLDKDVILRALDEPNFIPESTSLGKQLIHFKNSKEKISLVLDEYGSVTGLISMDDIFKEIVGEFTHQDYLEYVQNQSGSYQIEGSTLLRDLYKQFNWEFNDSKSRTINGYILELVKDFPQKDQIIQTPFFDFKIIEVSPTKINSIEVTPKIVQS